MESSNIGLLAEQSRHLNTVLNVYKDVHSRQVGKLAAFQAPKKEVPLAEDSEEDSSGSQSPAESDDEAAQGTPAAQSQIQQAGKPAPKQASASSPQPETKVGSAANKAAPVGVRARLQQSAAAAATVRAADSPPAAAAVEIVIPLVQVAALQPEPLLAPSVSPRLPYDSVDVGSLPARSAADLPYGGAGLATRNAPDAAMQQSATSDNLGDSIDRDDSAGPDANVFAARTALAAAVAEEPGVSAPPTGTKANKGICICCLYVLVVNESVCLRSSVWTMHCAPVHAASMEQALGTTLPLVFAACVTHKPQ